MTADKTVQPSTDSDLLFVLCGIGSKEQLASVKQRIAEGTLVPGWEQCRSLVALIRRAYEEDSIDSIPLLAAVREAMEIEEPSQTYSPLVAATPDAVHA